MEAGAACVGHCCDCIDTWMFACMLLLAALQKAVLDHR